MDLHPHQITAAADLLARVSRDGWAYLAGEVRTGKTLTVLTVARELGCQRVLFLTKKKAIASIERDRDALGIPAGQVVVTNFEQAHRQGGRDWDLLILDEAHCCGAYPRPSLRWRQISALRYDRCILLSGTPSPESLSQLYHQIRLGSLARLSTAVPWPQTTFYRWASSGFVTIRTKRVGTGQEVNDYSAANEDRIMADLAPHMVTMTQAEAGFAVQITEQIHRVRMAPDTYRLAAAIMRDSIANLPNGSAVVADTAAQQMSKLRQLYSGTVIPYGGGDGIILDTSKVRYILNRITGGRLAILYCFQAEGVMLRQAYGTLATESPEEFAARQDSVFIGQVQASREGVNLSPADDLVFLGIDYSALSYLQGRDRASAIGRTVPPRVHWILAANSLELQVYDRVRAKETYTTTHYRKDRGRFSSRSNQAVPF
jgi:hypothetical protein